MHTRACTRTQRELIIVETGRLAIFATAGTVHLHISNLSVLGFWQDGVKFTLGWVTDIHPLFHRVLDLGKTFCKLAWLRMLQSVEVYNV